MKKRVWSVVLAVTAVCGWAQERVSFARLVQNASEKSLELELYRTDIGIQETIVEQEKSALWPSLSLSFNTERTYAFDENRTGLDSIGDTVISSGTGYKSSLSFDAGFTLFDFGATAKKIEMAKKEREARRFGWCRAEKEVWTKILDLYVQALKTRHALETSTQILELRERSYMLKKRLYEAGKISRIDLGDEAIAAADERRKLSLYKKRWEELLFELSRTSHTELSPDGTVLEELEPFDGKSRVEAEFDATPEARELMARIAEKEEEISQYRRSQWPAVSLYGSYYLYGYDYRRLHRAVKNLERTSWRVGAGIRVPLFSGFVYPQHLRQLKLERERLRQELQLRRREFLYKKSELSYGLRQSRRILDAAKEAEEGALRMKELGERLRKERKIDELARIDRRIVALNRRLEAMDERTDAAYGAVALEILSRGVDECSLR